MSHYRWHAFVLFSFCIFPFVFFFFLKQLFLFRCLHWFLATQRTHIQSWYFFRFLKTMEVLVSGIFLPVVIRTQARVWHFCWTLIFFLATYLERIFFFHEETIIKSSRLQLMCRNVSIQICLITNALGKMCV